jgi:CheY-like chemotaxis protein
MKAETPFTVLLVEDHEDSRVTIKKWLEWKGWRVLEASNRKSGLALGRKHAIDLLLCDLQLPDGTGWQLMEQLNAAKPVRGILTSGHCASADIARSKAAGFLEHLIKPYPVDELDALLERVQRLLEHHAPIPPIPGTKRSSKPRLLDDG